MVSNQVIMDMLAKVGDITGAKVSVYLPDGTAVTDTGVFKSEKFRQFTAEAGEREEFYMANGFAYQQVAGSGGTEYVAEGPGTENGKMAVRFAALQLQNLQAQDQERFDKDSFIKNLLMDNLLLVDIYNRAKQIGIDTHAHRVAFLIETKDRDDTNALAVLKTLFTEENNDFVMPIDENDIVLVKELETEGGKELNRIAETIVDMLNTEALSNVHVSYGKVADEIRKVSNSFKEAKLAMAVGKIFNSEQDVYSYTSLGIGRLIYQLPIPMCKMFIEEIFKDQSPEDFDEETLTTIAQFFENNLNVSETSRQLYIHRNTLVYRLDKLQKNTGLDLRVFDDAIMFKIALMVVRYMHYMENQE